MLYCSEAKCGNVIKNLSLFLIISFSLLCCNSVYASDNINNPIIKTSSAFQQKAVAHHRASSLAAFSTGQAAAENKALSVQNKESAQPANETGTTKKISKKVTFADLLFRMMQGLVGALLLIALVVGVVLLYRFLLKKYLRKDQPIKHEAPSNIEKEPQTISEAVVSFVKHRIKKK